MKKTMKKIFVTVALTMLLCFSVSAFGNTVKTAEKLALNVKSEAISGYIDGLWTYYFLFIPSETATYDLTLESPNEIYAEVFDDKGNYIDFMDYNEFTESALCTLNLKANSKYYIKIEKWLFDEIIDVTAKVTKHTHTYKTYLGKATLYDEGVIYKSCSVCGYEKETTIPAIKTVKISTTSYTYDGKEKKPGVTVTDSKGKTLKKDTDYTVTYSANKAIRTSATVKITFKGNYSGSKSIKFKILPAQVTGLKASSITTTGFKLSWTKVSGAKYYKVEHSADGKTWKTLTTTDKTSYTVSKLTAGSKMQYRVTALDSTKKIAGKVSAVLKTGTKTTAPTVTLKSTKSKTTTVSWKKVAGASKYIVYKSTDSKNWTKATETTKLNCELTKLTAGKRIYVKVIAVNAYNQNSAGSKVVSVTVKK